MTNEYSVMQCVYCLRHESAYQAVNDTEIGAFLCPVCFGLLRPRLITGMRMTRCPDPYYLGHWATQDLSANETSRGTT